MEGFMKKPRLLLVLLILSVAANSFATPVAATDNIKVLIDGTELFFDVQPQIINNRVMVPMRKIFEELHATVEWDGITQTVTATRGDIVIIMQIDSIALFVSGKEAALDVPPQIVDNRVLVPVRAVSEALNTEVRWDASTNAVLITEGEQIPMAEGVPSSDRKENGESAGYTKRVGRDAFGYVTVPGNWIDYLDAEMSLAGIDHIGFISLEGIIINLVRYGARVTPLDQLVASLPAVAMESTEVKKTTISSLEAYQNVRYFEYDNTFLSTWYFYDNNSILRYISAEGPYDKKDEAIALVENTFSMSH
jgi:hypothetical protein